MSVVFYLAYPSWRWFELLLLVADIELPDRMSSVEISAIVSLISPELILESSSKLQRQNNNTKLIIDINTNYN